MSDKPVYQSQTGGEWHDVTDKEYAFRKELSGVYKTRILYPAAAYEAQRNEVERLKAENEKLKESNLELERLCDKTYVQQGADAYNHCCEVFEAWRVKRQKLDLPTHDWADGLYNSINWLQDTVEELEAENEAQAKRIEAIETLCTHDYESKDDFILRVKEILKNGDSK